MRNHCGQSGAQADFTLGSHSPQIVTLDILMADSALPRLIRAALQEHCCHLTPPCSAKAEFGRFLRNPFPQ
eukprot:5191408-Amphidinium_carterae.2